jgi:hypothetical protein
MKKILLLSLVALTAACCGTKKDVTNVDSLITDPAQYVGKEITFVGKAVITNLEAGRVAVFGTDSTKYIIVEAADSVKVCHSICGKQIEVAGTTREVTPGVFIVDSVCQKAFVIEKYYVGATSIKPAEGCCKKAEGGCKKGEEKSCTKDTTATAEATDVTVAE